MKTRTFTRTLTALALVAALPLQAYETGDWLVRGGVTTVAPDADSSNVFVGGADLGIGVDVDNNTQLGLNLVYFYTPQLAIEVLAATPFSHDITLNTVGALGSTKHLPPTVSANYYFNDTSAPFQPYVGVGVNYTVFFDEEFTDANAAAGFDDLSLDDSFGLSFQLGMDYVIDDKWHVNASARWIDIDTDATFTLNGTAGKVDVDIDPMVYTLSVGYRF
ncbi:outer membrane beta-barrel protein [Aestuariibacter halophilus]|uniref:Outer membrane beta-barrel protein n=1 Tax=Fluctibacter halophilus TaxID=226011 RepID=A0ABS8G950_9ALTE|nr:OmpW family outer membrane protein [Aestuariibacter halophilus]MCC2617092.1 outer membrane beta-barrel protein [Aestuariibacter halophilus]